MYGRVYKQDNEPSITVALLFYKAKCTVAYINKTILTS